MPGGRVAFAAIQSVPGASAADRRNANLMGPPAAGVRTSYESLLNSAGFSEIRVEDRTSEYRDALAGWMAALASRSTEVRELLGAESYEEKARSRQITLEAVDAGVLGRYLYAATRPATVVPQR